MKKSKREEKKSKGEKFAKINFNKVTKKEVKSVNTEA